MTSQPASGQLWPEDSTPEKQTSGGSPITAYCDGGSRGNPGPSGYGVLIQDAKGQTLGELSEFLGRKTNNFAEYSGMLAALEFALSHHHSKLKVISDSELMVKQIKGQYRVNSPELRPLYDEAKRRIAQLNSFQIQHVLREKNRRADELANLAMDRGTGRQTSEQSPAPQSGPAKEKLQPLSGFVKGGVVHLLDGELPEGVFVKVTRDRQ
jgi:ribonuclease HI